MVRSIDRARLQFIKNNKVIGHVVLSPLETKRMFTYVGQYKPNPERINFGSVHVKNDTLSFVGYMNQPEKILLFFNFESLSLNKDSWREMFRIMVRIGNYLGILGRKRRKGASKKSKNSNSTNTIRIEV